MRHVLQYFVHHIYRLFKSKLHSTRPQTPRRHTRRNGSLALALRACATVTLVGQAVMAEQRIQELPDPGATNRPTDATGAAPDLNALGSALVRAGVARARAP